jgi:hypothetical protein
MKRKVESIAHHRNGISGVPFHVVLFRDEDGSPMMAVVMDGTTAKTPCPAVAVFDRDKLAARDIAFASNSYRGDVFTPWLCHQINTWEAARHAAADAYITGVTTELHAVLAAAEAETGGTR